METVAMRCAYYRTTDFQDVMEIDKEWFDNYLLENPKANPTQIWYAALDEGFEPEIEWSEPDWTNEEIVECWIGDSRGV